jgi:hypothetical protein
LNKKLLSIPYLNLCKIVFYIIEMRFWKLLKKPNNIVNFI